jgi:hypothetical protein
MTPPCHSLLSRELFIAYHVCGDSYVVLQYELSGHLDL